MLHEFLDENRDDLIARCRAKVELRASPRPTAREMEHGIPLFLGQLIETLRIEQRSTKGLPTPGAAGRSLAMGVAATRHGNELLRRGFSVDQVVHDYGDLCQAITELADEKRTPVAPDEFRTLNGCLDDAIADAVTEFGRQRDQLISEIGDRAMSERLGYLAHELRSCLNTAVFAFAAIKEGHVGLRGATAEVLGDSLACLRDLIDRPFMDARLAAGLPPRLDELALDQLIPDLRLTANMEAKAAGCEFVVAPMEPGLAVMADKEMLFSAVSNLLRNAFGITRAHSHVTLKAHGSGDRVLIEVEDGCGGLLPAVADALSRPFDEGAAGLSGPLRGLSIARRAVEAMGGVVRAREVKGTGCVLTIDLPRCATGRKAQ